MPAGKPKLWTDADDKRLLRMYKEGYDRADIAESLGRTGEAVSDRKRWLLSQVDATTLAGAKGAPDQGGGDPGH